MIFEILIYFFMVFGILQFSVCIWEFFTSLPQSEDAFIILKSSENSPDTIRNLKKYPFKIYAVTDDITAHKSDYDNIEYITKDDILQKL
jgi:hypothetical protein